MKPSRFWWLFALGAAVCAQDPPASRDPDALETRLRLLETKAAKADILAARVVELEDRVRFFEEAESTARLEDSISALIARDPPLANVGSRRSKWLNIGGQLRIRSEYRTVTLYEAEDPRSTDEDITIQRTRFNVAARLLDKVRAFVEIQDTRVWGEEQTVLTNLQRVDLHQGYIDFEEVFGSPFTIRAGRFEMLLWNQRLISPLDWHPVSRAWDGVLLLGKTGEFDWLGGYQIIAEDPLTDSDRDSDFYWVSSTYRGIADHELGGAFFWWHSDTRPADFSFGTAALHAQGRAGGFDYSADLVGQWGDNAGRDVEAFAVAATVGYTFDTSWSPRVGIEWTWASGDEDPDDDRFQTFNPLFPFGHFYQGYLDIFAWRNGHDLALHLEAKPATDWWIELALHGFWLDETTDAWFNAAGVPIRFVKAADNRHVGFELDISAKYWLTKDIWLWFGYSHFFAGDFVEETGDAPDTDWFWLQLTASF